MKPKPVFIGRVLILILLGITLEIKGLEPGKNLPFDQQFFNHSSLTMNKLISIEKRLDLPEVSSGSGMAFIDDEIFIIGDDSPYLYQLNMQYELTRKHLLLEGLPTEGRIPKAIKPDFECMAEEKSDRGTSLYIFGSGSKSPERDLLLIYTPKQPDSLKQFVLTDLYQRIIEIGGIQREQLNLEAAVILDQQLYLFNRGHNQVFIIPLAQLKTYLNNTYSRPALQDMEIKVWHFELPVFNQIQSGFSGACALPGSSKIIFTATLEDTDNWIDDGEIYGSMLGIIDTRHPGAFSAQKMAFVNESGGDKAHEKIESISFTAYDPQGHLRLLAVADNDDGSSRLFILQADQQFLGSPP
jgi:hypothetical protein